MTRAAAAVFMLAALGAAAAAADIPFSERKSGYDFMARETRAMQDDDSANPATLWVLDGQTLWQRKEGSAGKSCADCHGDVAHMAQDVSVHDMSMGFCMECHRTYRGRGGMGGGPGGRRGPGGPPGG